MKCSICFNEIEKVRDPATNEVVWDKGNNAEPVNSGRCCNDCNGMVVIPVRLGLWAGRDEVAK